MDRLKSQRCRDTTRATYHKVWKLFSDFFIKLDIKPRNWEHRLILFTRYLVDCDLKSSTIRTYVSAIRSVLAEDGFELDHHNFTITALTRACQIRHDKLVVRLPIHQDLLELLCKELKVWSRSKNQPYLEHLYAALLVSGYYGLLRVGELTNGPDCLLANNVHVAVNKRKLLFMLMSSKTHNKGDKPQIIKISGRARPASETTHGANRYCCPYAIIQQYISV